jgi:hypothetical protein
VFVNIAPVLAFKNWNSASTGADNLYTFDMNLYFGIFILDLWTKLQPKTHDNFLIETSG